MKDNFGVRFADYSGKVQQLCIYNVADEDAAKMKLCEDVRLAGVLDDFGSIIQKMCFSSFSM